MSPTFNSFYTTNSFTKPLQKDNIIYKKHITENKVLETSIFEALHHQNERKQLIKNQYLKKLKETKKDKISLIGQRGNFCYRKVSLGASDGLNDSNGSVKAPDS